MKIYVGNLAYDVTKEELQAEFTAFGAVASVELIMDKFSGRPKGFAFVEMPAVTEGQAAINKLNGKTLKNRPISVSAARPREDRGRPGNRSGGYGRDQGRSGGGRSGGYSRDRY
jgi:RNA recognition motif-containing protein